MTWTADSDKAGIQPGQFQDFPISVQIPGEAGDTLTFKALQTYDDGEVVRWIGAPESEEPAPQVAVTEGSEEPPRRGRRFGRTPSPTIPTAPARASGSSR